MDIVDLLELRERLAPSGRPRLVNHWATWCEGCVEELPDLVALVREIGGRAEVVSVGWEGFNLGFVDADMARDVGRVAAAAGMDWPTLLYDGEPDALFEGLELSFRQIPQTRLIDGEGRVLVSVEGLLDEEAARRIRDALAE